MEDRDDTISVSTEKVVEDPKFTAGDPESDDLSDYFCKDSQTASSFPPNTPKTGLRNLTLDLSGKGICDCRGRAESLSSGYMTINECCDAVSPFATSPRSMLPTPSLPLSVSGHNLMRNFTSTPTYSPNVTPSSTSYITYPLPLSPAADLKRPANQYSVDASTGERTFSMRGMPQAFSNGIQDGHTKAPSIVNSTANNEFGDVCKGSLADTYIHSPVTHAVPVTSDYIQSDSYNVAPSNTDAVAHVRDHDAISLSEEEEEEEEGSELPVHLQLVRTENAGNQSTNSDYIQESSAAAISSDYQQSRPSHICFTQLSLAEQVEADTISLPPTEEGSEKYTQSYSCPTLTRDMPNSISPSKTNMSLTSTYIKDSTNTAVVSSDYIDPSEYQFPASTFVPLDKPDATSLTFCEEVYQSEEEEGFDRHSSPPPSPPPSPAPPPPPHPLLFPCATMAGATPHQPVTSSGYITQNTTVTVVGSSSADTYRSPSPLSLVSLASSSEEVNNDKLPNVFSHPSKSSPIHPCFSSCEVFIKPEYTCFPEPDRDTAGSNCITYPPQGLDAGYPSGYITAR